MNRKINKRIFKSDSDIINNLSYKQLKNMLELEKRTDSKAAIKELLFNKVFAQSVFAICIGLNIIFLGLATLNYFGMIG